MRSPKSFQACLAGLPVAGLLAMLWVSPLAAQSDDVRIRVATQSGPHYVGVGAIVQLTVGGLKSEPEPTCEVDAAIDGVRVNLLGISPQIVQQTFRSADGSVRRFEQVTHTIQFQVVAEEAGDFLIGPFVIKQDGFEKRQEAIEMSFQDVELSDDIKIQLNLPDGPIYPDQRVPVEIEFWFAGDIGSTNIHSPLFDQFRFAPDREPRRGQSQMPINTSEGLVMLAAEGRADQIDGQPFTVVTATRTLIPDRPGTFEIDPISVTVKRVTSWRQRRSPFGGSLLDEVFGGGGGREPATTEMIRAIGEPLTVVVKPFPTAGRPESFSGTVGKGFTLDVSADRTVVRVGDPIRLSIRLRGDGNIETASLPSLSADGGLDPERFRLPEGDLVGLLDRGVKRFEVSVRVMDESINEIPAIAYSWFDAEAQTYQTTRSKPIALRVDAAKMVGADSVVSARSVPSRAEATGNEAETESRTETNRFTLSGADLSIAREPESLLGTGGLDPTSLHVAGYAMGSACLLIAWFDQRRRRADPEVRERAERIHKQKAKIREAKGLPAKEAAERIAAALQVVAADANERAELDKLMSELEMIAFQPSGSSSTLPEELFDRAIKAVDDAGHGSEDA